MLVQLASKHNYATLGVMKNLAHAVAALLITAWVGALWAIGYLAAPVLFYAQPDRQLAGLLAGQMFTWVNYLGMACAAYLLIYRIRLFGGTVLRQPLFWIVAVMLLITLILQCGLQPAIANLKAQVLPADIMHSTLAGRFKMLHGISSILYLIESLLGVMLVIKPRHIFQA
ncbi:MAG TPA: DUF4149 domain-containing protein [Gallionella sp.]|nr:DUF4149 domain-containing protein [Gallionella sp.]